MDREDQRLMSLRLSRVLEDIGVNKYIIARRRKTWLVIEAMCRLFSTLKGDDAKCYYFGSQSEGTTTIGMNSDVDTLNCFKPSAVILDWGEWKEGKYNLLVLKTDHSPPQHCMLQRVRPDLPLPETREVLPSDVVDREGRVLVPNTFLEKHESIRALGRLGQVLKHGPSKSWDEMFDYVLAYHCANLPEECQFLFNRPRPGHWPRNDTLVRARQTGVFLMPQGYTESPSRTLRCRSTALHVSLNDLSYPKSNMEWRFSTSMMERLLMFDMNTVQHKTYVLIKIIRKSFFKPVVGDRFTTFHIKTAVLFTIETYPTGIWKDNNLLQCVFYCLNTLKRCLKIKYCPHYTISNVNLFTGKLFKHELKVITEMITSMITSDLQCIYEIEMDSLGARMSALSVGRMNSETITRNMSNTKITFEVLSQFNERCQVCTNLLLENSKTLECHQYVRSISQYITTLVNISERGSDLQQESASFLISNLRCTLASVLASRCIHQGQPITQDILNLYQLSFDSDLLSSRLKFASMLYCSGQYEAAETCLTFCEGLIGPSVWQYCECHGRRSKTKNRSLEIALNQSNKEILTKHICNCIHFTRHETFCIPDKLVFEMFKTITEEDRQYRNSAADHEWMDLAVVDCIPFLHYLQFLTSRQLGQHTRAFDILLKLAMYMFNDLYFGHIDATLNMQGHCCELVYWLDETWISFKDLAWILYGTSVRCYPRNNAANWHVARLLHQRINN